MKPSKTVHSNRTMMFEELARVMDHGIEQDNYRDQLNQNVISKATQTGVKKTARHLKSLYDFDITKPAFKALKYFWSISDDQKKPILSILYAIGNDYLLADSIPIIDKTSVGQKVQIVDLEENIELHFPQKYTNNSKRSAAQNIASSWKQAGYITGKIKKIRTQPEVDYLVVTFAFFLAYLKGIRGDFILKSDFTKALFLDESNIRSLAVEAGKRDLLQYQFAGNVTSITFNNLLNKLEIYGFEN